MRRECRITFLPAIGLILGLMAGCHNSATAPVPKTLSVATDPNLQVSLQMTPLTPRQMDPTQFTVHLTDSHARPVSKASVGTELTMPTMAMGQNAVVLAPTAPGVYSGTGRFSMDGDWVVVVTVTQVASKTVRSFPAHVR
jgi:hypothetical protein